MLVCRKLTDLEDGRSGLEALEAYERHAKENDGRTLFTMGGSILAKRRPKIDEALFYIDSETAFLVSVVAVGLGHPKQLTPAPQGFEAPDEWKNEEQRTTWMALQGPFKRVSPKDYALDSNGMPLVQAFDGKRPSLSYVHQISAK